MGVGLLTVGQLEELENGAGRSLMEFRARDLRALLHALGADGGMRVADLESVLTVDDVDGIAARYIGTFGGEPWCWPPDVTRRQLVSDLDFIIASIPKGNT